jgi:predicted TIM-barrel fold metal-dependent hydrolase
MQPFLRTPTFAAVVLLSVAAVFLSNLLPASGAQNQLPLETHPAMSPFVDVHTHPDPADPERSVGAALEEMKLENAAKIVFMPPPFTADDPGRYDAEILLPAVKGRADKLAVLGGGGSLNAMIQESVKTGDAGPEILSKFKERAEELLRLGAVGFGELTAEHFQGATPYQSAPPDHPLFLLLADIAAEHGVPIDLHMEAVPQTMPLPAPLKSPPNPPQLRANIAAFERLLAHNPRARIIWAHAGWDNTGYRTPALCRRLLQAHPNLYMDVKIDPLKPGRNSPLTDGASGAIKPEWLQLFRDFPDRFVVGTDQHYPEPRPGPQRWEAIVSLINQLPADLQKKIGMENATRLFAASSKSSR